MSDMICLTPEEVEGLRELLAWCAVVEERGFQDERRIAEITYQTWHHMTRGPKQKLSRLTRYRALQEQPE